MKAQKKKMGIKTQLGTMNNGPMMTRIIRCVLTM